MKFFNDLGGFLIDYITEGLWVGCANMCGDSEADMEYIRKYDSSIGNALVFAGSAVGVFVLMLIPFVFTIGFLIYLGDPDELISKCMMFSPLYFLVISLILFCAGRFVQEALPPEKKGKCLDCCKSPKRCVMLKNRREESWVLCYLIIFMVAVFITGPTLFLIYWLE